MVLCGWCCGFGQETTTGPNDDPTVRSSRSEHLLYDSGAESEEAAGGSSEDNSWKVFYQTHALLYYQAVRLITAVTF